MYSLYRCGTVTYILYRITCTEGRRHPTLAIARPFSIGDVDLLPDSFDTWRMFPPCRSDSSVMVDVFLIYAQNLDESIRAQSAIHATQELFDMGHDWSACINAVFGFGVDIGAEEDLYLPDQQSNNMLWVNGPNRQFERTIRALQNGPYELMFLMEMDCVPRKEFWLDMIMGEIEIQRLDFVILGSKYRGKKWDTFRDILPSSLINHINGNAIYNLTHPLLSSLVEQLEREAGTIANSVPFDYRICQIVEEVQTGLIPYFGFGFNEDETDYKLPDSLIFIVRQFDTDSLIRETPLIANYAATNVLPSRLNYEEAVVHGATFLIPWDSTEVGEISLVVSDFHPPRAQPMLLSLEQSSHPFTRVIVLSDRLNGRELVPSSSIATHLSSRAGKVVSADICTADVRTPWFMMSNSYFKLQEEVQITLEKANNGFKPVISFEEPQFESCFSDEICSRDFEIGKSISSGFQKIFQDFDFVFHTRSRNEYCRFLSSFHNATWRDYPSATSFVAYLEKSDALQQLYSLSDRRKYGSNFIFVAT